MKEAGTPSETTRVLCGLERLFGKIKVQSGVFEHCGVIHEQKDGIIVIHQNHYAKQLKT